MRGLPPLQAILLLMALAVLGFAGSHYIKMGSTESPPPSASNNVTNSQTVEAEIEFVFSSPPLSYTLTEPSSTGGEDRVIIKSSAPIGNPCYETVNLALHKRTTYWLDVVWPEDAKHETRHFVQLNVSPNQGESQQYSFSGDSKYMNETFDYHNGDHHHE